jgi:hypothetical protein
MESSTSSKGKPTVPQAPPLPGSLLLAAAGQQGTKLAYLDKKFKENNNNNNNNEYSSSTSCTSSVRTRSTFKKAAIANNAIKRLSCEELEDLKEKFVDFIKLDQAYLDHSVSSSSSSSSNGNGSGNNIFQSSPTTIIMTNQPTTHNQPMIPSPPLPPPPPPDCLIESKPEPPARTVSIRNSSIYSSILKPEDSVSIKSGSIYGVGHLQQQHVRNSRSVFSIYEEEAAETCSSSGLSSHSSSSTTASSPNSSNNSCCQNVLGNVTGTKLERLADYEVKKLEAMYRSMGSIVCVGPCTCDLFTTTSEQVASMLSNCWRMEMSSFVPIWIFDTGYNLKRAKRLTLLFVDRQTAFPLLHKPLLVTQMDQFRNPNNDKRLTFTLSQQLIIAENGKCNNKALTTSDTSDQKLVGLIQFYDFLCCHEFFKFYREVVENVRNFDMFENSKQLISARKGGCSKNFSSSMMTLNNSMSGGRGKSGPSSVTATGNVSEAQVKKFNRYSEYIPYSINYDEVSSLSPMMNITAAPLPPALNAKLKTVRTITKSCISSPCAFQHVNSLKSNNDQHIKLLIDNFNVSEKKLLSKENLQIVRLRKK